MPLLDSLVNAFITLFQCLIRFMLRTLFFGAIMLFLSPPYWAVGQTTANEDSSMAGIARAPGDDSSLRARKGKFDVRGQIPCAQERGQQMSDCTVGVARGGGGDATVVVRFSNGFERTLYFLHGEFISANATMSGSGSDTDWQKEGGLYLIRVDDQRYELHHNLIFGK